MSNFEKIEDYLANRLSPEDQADFTRQMEADQSLRQEVNLQQHIIKNIQQARVSELKHMLNQIPVPSAGWTLASKVAAVAVTAGLVGSVWYYLQPKDQPAPAVLQETVVASPAVVEPKETTPVVDPQLKQAPDLATNSKKTEDVVKKKPAQTITPSQPVVKPNLQVMDPTQELISEHPDGTGQGIASSPVRVGHAAVSATVHTDDTSHSFHYQFQDGKLHLFGPFDNNLYEILEINGVDHAVFLFYQDSYYLLDQQKSVITALQPIKDSALLSKLKQYRSR